VFLLKKSPRHGRISYNLVPAFAAVAVLAAAANARADQIPYYPSPGTPSTANYTFTATSSGDVVAYFAGNPSNAGYTSEIGMLVNGVSTGVTGLDNLTSTIGQSLDLGSVAAGDTITFLDYVSNTNSTYYSNSALNGTNGTMAYATNFNGSSSLPAGLFVGFGDVPQDYPYYNYDATNFVATNVALSPSPVPLPASAWLLISGLGGLGAAARRRVTA